MGWFEGRATKEKKTAVKNALAVMTADGNIDPKEVAHLARVATRVGLSQKQLKEILDAPGKVELVVPESRDERVRQLFDMVFMMLADGKIDKREMDMCMTLAARMGFPSSIIPDLLKKLIEAAQQGRQRADVSVEIGSYLGK